jgi:hypothetical protein
MEVLLSGENALFLIYFIFSNSIWPQIAESARNSILALAHILADLMNRCIWKISHIGELFYCWNFDGIMGEHSPLRKELIIALLSLNYPPLINGKKGGTFLRGA